MASLSDKIKNKEATDPPVNPYHFDRSLYKKGISHVESSGGVNLWNRTSTGTGKYQHLYDEIKHLPILKGVTRKMFRDNEALQEIIMDRDIDNKIKDRPGAYKNARDLTIEYKDKLGDRWNYRPDEIAAMSHFMGRGRTRKYFKSQIDGTPFSIPGNNKTVEQYLRDYNTGAGLNRGIKGYTKKERIRNNSNDVQYPAYGTEEPITSNTFTNENLFAQGGYTDLLNNTGCSECDEKALAEGGYADTDPPTKTTKLSVEEYRNAFKKGKYNNFSTPFPTKKINGEILTNNNCINGVCTIINDATGENSPLDRAYTGNMTFEDNAQNLGFYPIKGKNVETIHKGDIVQYQRYKASRPDLFPGEDGTGIAGMDTYPYHGSIVTDVYKNSDGIPMVSVANNSGKDIAVETEFPLDVFLKRIHGDSNNFKEGATIQRYNPEEALKYNPKDNDYSREILGDNEHYMDYMGRKPNIKLGDTATTFSAAETLSAILNPIDKISDTYKQGKVPEELGTYYSKHYNTIGSTSNVTPEILDEMFTAQVGIAKQETRFGTSVRQALKKLVPDRYLEDARNLKDAFTFSNNKIPGWIQEYYTSNVENVQDKYNTVEKFASNIENRYKKGSKNKGTNTSARSKGMFQQKKLSARGKYLGGNFETTEGQFLASMGLMLDNFHEAKKLYPSLSDQKLKDVAILMHNAPLVASIPEYVNYFIEGKDSDYVNKVTGNTENTVEPSKQLATTFAVGGYTDPITDPKKKKYSTQEDAPSEDFEMSHPGVVLPTVKNGYPYYNTLTNSEKELLEDKGPLGRGVRKMAREGRNNKLAEQVTSILKQGAELGAQTVGAGVAIGTGIAVAPAVATAAAPYVNALTTSANISVPGVAGMNVANAVNSGFAADFVANRAPDIPKKILEEDYIGAVEQSLYGALDLAGAGVLKAPTKAVSKLASKVTPRTKRTAQLAKKTAINLERPSKAKKTRGPRWETTDIGHGMVEKVRLRKGGRGDHTIRKVELPGENNYIELKKYTGDTGEDLYYFSAASSESSLGTGRAFKHLEASIPKGAKILENKSLSTDSFYSTIRRAENPKKFTWTDENKFIPLNNQGRNRPLANADKAISHGEKVVYEDYNEAVKAVQELNSRVTIPGVPKAKLTKIKDKVQLVEGGPEVSKTVFGIDLPNIGLIKNYGPEASTEVSKAVKASTSETVKADNYMKTALSKQESLGLPENTLPIYNVDGTPFIGNAEQRALQRSPEFREAYPNGAGVIYRGGNFTADLEYGRAGIGTARFGGEKKVAEAYGDSKKIFDDPTQVGREPGLVGQPMFAGEEGMFELYHPLSNNSVDFTSMQSSWGELNLKPYAVKLKQLNTNMRIRKDKIKRFENVKIEGAKHQVEGVDGIMNKQQYEERLKAERSQLAQEEAQLRHLATEKDNPTLDAMKSFFAKTEEPVHSDDIAEYIENNNLDYATIRDIYDSTDFPGIVRIINNKKGNFLKSTRGGSNKKDLNNPNIFKAYGGYADLLIR